MAISANSSKSRLNCRKSRLNWIILRLNFLCIAVLCSSGGLRRTKSDTNIGGYGVLAVATHPHTQAN